MPLFSIITATYNAAPHLPRLLASLAEQTCRDFELIIQDGASADETVAIAEAWRDKLPAISIESTSDTGIYDAWNKALPRIRGKWVLFLGADDTLASAAVLEKAREALAPFSQATYGIGQLDLVDREGKILRKVRPELQDFLRKRLYGMPFPHSALFHNHTLFYDYTFNTEYKITGDYDFLLKTWDPSGSICFLPFVVTNMTDGGCSNNCANSHIMQRENSKIRNTYFPFSKFPKQRIIHALSIQCIWEKCNPCIRLIKSIFLVSATGTRMWCVLQRLRRKCFDI